MRIHSLAVTLVLLARIEANAQVGNVQHVHDPVVAKDGDKYWLFSTGPRIPCRKSRDLRTWEWVGPTLSGLPDWSLKQVPGAKDFWAPDISYFNKRWHLYYSVSTFGSNRSCIGLATNTTLDPANPSFKWEDRGLVLKSQHENDYNCIDPNVVLDEKGAPWLSFGSFWSGIKLVRLDPASGRPAGQLIHIAGRHGGAIEAPFIVRNGGWYYLFVSFDQCCKGNDSTYKMMVGRSRAIQGPYLAFDGGKMTDGAGTLVLAGYRQVRGPGHNGFISTPKGDFVVHHFYDRNSGGVPTLQVRRVVWIDGWPVVGEPTPGIDSDERRPANRGVVAGEWIHIVGEGDGGPLRLDPNGKIGGGSATWAVRGNSLEMRWPRADAPNGAWIDKCHVSGDGRWYAGRNQQGTLIRGIKK